MTPIRLVLTFLATTRVLLATNPAPLLPPESAAGYTLTWRDEFDGSTLNTAEWNIRTGPRFASENRKAKASVAEGWLRLAVNGKLVGVTHATNFQHDVMSIWLTTIGWFRLPWAPDIKIDDTALPASADFDYVRFFEKPALASEKPPLPRTIVVFGDSLTEGGALPPAQRDSGWVQLVERDSKGSLKLLNEGKGGRPTQCLPEFELMLRRHLRISRLVIALGTNNSRDITAACVPKAVGNLRIMVGHTRSTFGPALPVLLVGPPNVNKAALVATQLIAKERETQLRALGGAFELLAIELDCGFAPLFGKVPDATMTKDGVHPDAAGNAAIAKVLETALSMSP